MRHAALFKLQFHTLKYFLSQGQSSENHWYLTDHHREILAYLGQDHNSRIGTKWLPCYYLIALVTEEGRTRSLVLVLNAYGCNRSQTEYYYLTIFVRSGEGESFAWVLI